MIHEGLTDRETIFVVDDTDAVRDLVVHILESAKFKVLKASSGEDAMRVASAYPGKIDLLLSDIQMPGMSGPDLGVALKLLRPDLRVMLMSSFSGGALLVLNYGWAFIEKPFVAAKLVEMVEAVLSEPDKSQGSTQYDTRDDLGLK
jgi:DNA-binding NtrC family response regulator